MAKILIIGGGPAGLMAAEVASGLGHSVTLAEAKPTLGRKFLMAGKSGLNLTKDEPLEDFHAAYPDADPRLLEALGAFDPKAVAQWAEGLGQAVFTGSTGRVFPKAMKASPLLRAWIGRLSDAGVQMQTRWRWLGPVAGGQRFQTPTGDHVEPADATILALGGASWARLGSDGAWAEILAGQGVGIAPFQPANMGVRVNWSDKMARHFGAPVKNTAISAGGRQTRGEFVIASHGIEGGGIYEHSRAIRAGARVFLDLCPNREPAQIVAALEKTRMKDSLANRMRKALGLTPVQIGLFFECIEEFPGDAELVARQVKKLHLPISGAYPIDQAISVAGGVAFADLDDHLMLRAMPGVFVAGEMLDWEAPTGGYLISACLATGRSAAFGAQEWLASARPT